MVALQQGIYFTGIAGDYVSTPDAAALDITGPIDIRVEKDVNALNGSDMALVTKWNETAQRSYELYEGFFFVPGAALRWSTDGTVVVAPTAAFVTGAATLGQVRAMRCVLTPATGIGRFEYSNTIDGPWGEAQEFAGLPVAQGATSIFAGTGELAIGAIAGGATRNFKGFIKKVRLYNGIGPPRLADPAAPATTPVLDVDFTKWPAGSTTMVAPTGQTLTLNGFDLTATQANAFRAKGIDTPASNLDLSIPGGGGIQAAGKLYSTGFHGWRHFLIADMVQRGFVDDPTAASNSLYAQIK